MNLSAVLAVLLLSPALAVAAAGGPAPEQAAAVSAHKGAKSQMHQDQATLKADWDALKTACKTKGASCDAAKAKVEADRAKAKADRANLDHAAATMKRTGVIGQTRAEAAKRTKRTAKPKKQKSVKTSSATISR
jgi:hypothetical protein